MLKPSELICFDAKQQQLDDISTKMAKLLFVDDHRKQVVSPAIGKLCILLEPGLEGRSLPNVKLWFLEPGWVKPEAATISHLQDNGHAGILNLW